MLDLRHALIIPLAGFCRLRENILGDLEAEIGVYWHISLIKPCFSE
jgi:hypothetical protein